MSKLKVLLPAVVAVSGLALSVVVAKSKPAPTPREVPVQAPAQVDVLTVESFSGSVLIRSQGIVRPRRQIDWVTQVAGEVLEVAPQFVDGGAFSADSKLLQIDPRDYEIAVIRAQAKLADAQQKLATETGQAKQARKQWRDLGDSEANALFLRKPQLASARAQVQAAEADLRQARLDLERTALVAPFAGRIVDTKADLGQFLPAGAAIASLYASDTFEVALALTARQQALLPQDAIAQGLSVNLTAALNGKTLQWPATISRFGAQIDEATRTLNAFAEIDNPLALNPPVLVGQFVDALIPSRRMDRLYRVPMAALRPGNQLWVLDDRQQLAIAEVRVVEAEGDHVVVQADTDKALNIIVSYLANGTPGRTLSIREAVGAAL